MIYTHVLTGAPRGCRVRPTECSCDGPRPPSLSQPQNGPDTLRGRAVYHGPRAQGCSPR
jgi:hypothetical protein